MLKNAPLLLLLIALLSLGACTSARRSAGLPAGSAPPPGQQALPALAGTSLPGGLPDPAQLAGKLGPAPRRSSYLPEDLARPGDGFDPLLPSQNIQDGNGDITMISTFGQPGSPGFSGAAFAGYRFTLPDYEGNSLISYSMTNAPATETDLYIGLANWGANRWDLFQGSAGHSISPPSLTPYFLPDGSLLALVLLVGVNSLELSEIRVGSPPPDVTLTASPRFGLAPMTVNFSAAGASDPDGSIVQYRWDPEGDGVFDLSTGAEPTLQHEYSEQGSFNAAVRVFDDQGVYSEQHLTINTANRSMFSYGGDFADESAQAVVVCDDGHLLVFGHSVDAFLDSSQIVAKLSPEGSEDFCFFLSIGADVFIADARLASDGFVYAVGSTSSGAETDALLQKWSQAGELVWCKTLGGPEDLEAFNSINVLSDKIYISGSYRVASISRSLALAARLDIEGNPEWFTSIIAPASCSFRSMALFPPSQVLDGGLALCGNYGHSEDDSDAFYAFLDFDGGLVTTQILGESNIFESAVDIALTSGILPTTYITGTLGNGSKNFLYKSGLTPSFVEVSQSGDSAFVTGMALIGASPTLLLQSSYSSSELTTLVAALNSSLVNTGSLYAVPGDATNVFQTEIVPYGSGSFVVTGSLGAELPVSTSSPSLTVSSAALAWEDISPASGSPSTLELTTLNVSPVLRLGYEFNRQQADDDMFVILDAAAAP